MNIKTETPLVKKAREGVMEFLLANHPLDCPICDQGGECDLQDQAMAFGSDRGRFTEAKRSVADKNLGPLVKTVMTRCIHCTRCIRFAKEIAGIQDLGITGRGRDAEVGTYVEKTMTSELSGNVIDLCPVGALTSKPAAFTYRNWELRTTDSIDVSDAIGSNIRVDARGLEVIRILPRLNEDINQEWISDKTRFQYDGLRYQRLTTPLVKNSQTGRLASASWGDALAAGASALQGVKGNEIRAIAGKLADAESMVALKDFMNRLGSGDLRHEGGFSDMDADLRATYLFNSTFRGIDSADAIVLIGTNPRKEGAVLNARVRGAAVAGVPVAVVGEAIDLTYPYDHLGEGVDALEALSKPSSEWFKKLKGASKPLIIVGSGVLRRADREALLARLHKLVEKAGVMKGEEGASGWNGFNILHDSASRVAALDLGFLPSSRARAASKPKVVYLLGSDDYAEADVPDDAFVIYQGHHGDRGAVRADVVLPTTAFTEKSGLYANTEGRVQSTRAAVPSLGDARDDWKVVRALSEVTGGGGHVLPYDTLDEVRARVTEITGGGGLSALWGLSGEYWKAVGGGGAKKSGGKQDDVLKTDVENFYQTDAISRASKTMARCVKAQQETMEFEERVHVG